MTRRPDVARELAKLKGFQRTTVEYAFDRLYRAHKSSHRFLVADEVGLGKTLVARGVIAKAIDHRWDSVDRIDVVYICSNASIARQNVGRLSIFPEENTHRVDRLTLLPKAIGNLRQNKVNLIAFTPGTSFDLKSSGGRWQERVVLYWMLQSIWTDPSTGPKNLMQGRVDSASWFRRQLDAFDEKEMDPGIRRAFEKTVRRRMHDERSRGEPTLKKRYGDLCERFGRLRGYSNDERTEQFRFIGELRMLLAETCIRALEPDLVILDEFQRFRDLLRPDDEAGQLAEGLFTYADHESAVRILLLSATPYKMYTLQHEQAEDDHYKDFLRTFEFISNRGSDCEVLRVLLEEYRRELYRLGNGGGAERLEQLKHETEATLRRYMCRTERLRPTGGNDGMLRTASGNGVGLLASEVGAFAKLEAVAELVEQPGVIEYWKSAPYLLSFMDKYKVKQEVIHEVARPHSQLRDQLTAAPELLVDWLAFEGYRRLEPQNGRLRWLEQWLDSTGVWKLLWLPPTLPYWELAGPFRDVPAGSLTKRLVFSGWNVVPKAIASMMSYEVERRIFQGFEKEPENSPEARKLRRPLLRFQLTRGRLTGMPVLGLMYPSSALVSVVDPAKRLNGERSGLDALLREVEGRLRPRVEALVGEHAASAEGREDEAWYWAAPILMDLAEAPEATRAWLARPELAVFWSQGMEGMQGDEEADQGWAEHVAQAVELAGGKMNLGAPPADLVSLLAKLAIAGPGVCASRALTRKGLGGADPRGKSVRDASARVAWAFRALFNQPEAMALLRADRKDLPYWRMALDYAAEGCLQAVLDEFAHMSRDLEGLIDQPAGVTVTGVGDAIVEALTLRTSTAQVDDLDLQAASGRDLVRHRRMRNHFALRFAAQESEEGAAGARIERVRGAFNSPFWPFILLTTSVGQEGLDFHPYCHAVVHWNLPSNPVDLEQREGRVHRYKGHAVRKNVAARHGFTVLGRPDGDVWERLFTEAAERDGPDGHGLVPYWIYPGAAAVERHAPTLPLSRETVHMEALKRSLAVYRMVFGQPRQDDLMAYLLDQLGEDRLNELVSVLQVDLSPALAIEK